ncbi:RNA polymerase sigma factor [Paenibacillus sabuli]|uniref:RNA polymerase sigma factor n=1 Tax=Paenibacillus sabuli TaxID=2772509 RepID=UPI001CC29D73|nr:RNA polymerase sigma factor [Paenibacillus sabuli]
MEEHGQDVWNYAYFLTRNPHQADDIAQDVFIKAYERIADYRGDAPIRHWLLAITRNMAHNARNRAFISRMIPLEWVRSRDVSPSAEHEYFTSSRFTDPI